MIYLDNCATTRPLKEIISKCEEKLYDNYFNPSALYNGGLEAKKILEESRQAVLSQFGKDYDVIFTSCGSEADNMALFSCAKRGNFVTTEGEHSAIFSTAQELKQRGVDVRFAKLNRDGSVNVEHLLSLVDQNTTLVSVIHINNESGAINDINYIAKQVKAKSPRTVFHSDGVQAFMKIPYKIDRCVDLYSLSAHKIGALKGVGALIKKKSLDIKPLIFGGGQENGLRSGTENVYGIFALGYAINQKVGKLQEICNYVQQLKVIATQNLTKEGVQLISTENGSPYILTFSAKGLRGEVLQRMLNDKGVYVATGSACSSKHRYSRILKACGYQNNVLDGVLRISFCQDTTKEEVLEAINIINGCIAEMRNNVI